MCCTIENTRRHDAKEVTPLIDPESTKFGPLQVNG